MSQKKKRKIIIISTGLRIGGVERSLIGLLEAIDSNRYDVSLFLFRHDGELMNMIPPHVELLPENKCYAAIELSIKKVLFTKQFPIALSRLTAKLVSALRARFLGIGGFLLPRSVRYCLPFLPALPGKYDLALSFLSPHDPILKKVSSKRRVGWIHTDYGTMESGVDHSFELPLWQALDNIAAVSPSVKEAFAQVFPEVAEKLIVIENMVSSDFIRRQAEKDVSAEMLAESEEIQICSVGRFCHAKNFETIPMVVKELNKLGIRTRWYLIGFGSGETLIRRKINEANVGKQVIILGKKSNPYPYMKTCDIYVQPSRYEGKAVAVREAQILGKPVLITDFPTSKSQLEDGVDGAICSLGVEGVVNGIKTLIVDDELRNHLVGTTATRDYSNRSEVKKIYQLLEQQ